MPLFIRRFTRFDVLLLLASTIPAVYLFHMIFQAARFPFELEIREGVTWLHVLAEGQGISIYDHRQLAFQGSWPSDHLFKTFMHLLFPGLPSQVIVRCFVIALPFALMFFIWNCFSQIGLALRSAVTLLAFSAVYVGMANLKSYNLLVGRADPATLTFLCIQAALTARIFHRQATTLALSCACGVAAALSILTVWRIFPSNGAFFLMGLVALNRSQWIPFVLGFTVSATLTFLAVLFYSFGGEFSLLYNHCVYIFIKLQELEALKPWEIFPTEMISDKGARLAVLFPMLVFSATLFFSRYRRDLKIIVGLGLMALGYLTFSFGYSQNKSGGGLYYFSPFVIFMWFLILTTYGSRWSQNQRAMIIGLVLIGIVPNWSQIQAQTINLSSNYESAMKFREYLEDLDRNDLIASETYHLYKTKLALATVDAADVVARIVRLNAFDSDFNASAERYQIRLAEKAPPFFLSGGVESERTVAFIRQLYAPVSQGPSYDQMNAPGGCVSSINCPILWQKK